MTMFISIGVSCLIFVSAVVLGQETDNRLRCYSCTNCPEVTEQDLVTCEADTPIDPEPDSQQSGDGELAMEGFYFVSRIKRQSVAEEREYLCFTITQGSATQEIINRGCGLSCEITVPDTTCVTCNTNKCNSNSAVSIKVSVILMFAALVSRFL